MNFSICNIFFKVKNISFIYYKSTNFIGKFHSIHFFNFYVFRGINACCKSSNGINYDLCQYLVKTFPAVVPVWEVVLRAVLPLDVSAPRHEVTSCNAMVSWLSLSVDDYIHLGRHLGQARTNPPVFPGQWGNLLDIFILTWSVCVFVSPQLLERVHTGQVTPGLQLLAHLRTPFTWLRIMKTWLLLLPSLTCNNSVTGWSCKWFF